MGWSVADDPYLSDLEEAYKTRLVRLLAESDPAEIARQREELKAWLGAVARERFAWERDVSGVGSLIHSFSEFRIITEDIRGLVLKVEDQARKMATEENEKIEAEIAEFLAIVGPSCLAAQNEKDLDPLSDELRRLCAKNWSTSEAESRRQDRLREADRTVRTWQAYLTDLEFGYVEAAKQDLKRIGEISQEPFIAPREIEQRLTSSAPSGKDHAPDETAPWPTKEEELEDALNALKRKSKALAKKSDATSRRTREIIQEMLLGWLKPNSGRSVDFLILLLPPNAPADVRSDCEKLKTALLPTLQSRANAYVASADALAERTRKECLKATKQTDLSRLLRDIDGAKKHAPVMQHGAATDRATEQVEAAERTVTLWMDYLAAKEVNDTETARLGLIHFPEKEQLRPIIAQGDVEARLEELQRKQGG